MSVRVPPPWSPAPRAARRPLQQLLWVAALVATGCTTSNPLPPDGLTNPRGLAVVCMEGDGVKPLADCASDNNVRAFVTGGSVGSVSVARYDGTQWTWFDTDASVPGFTPLMLGELPSEIVADPNTPKWLYMTLALGQEIVRVDASALSPGKRVALPFHPDAIVVSTDAAPRLYMADTAGAAVWWMKVSDFDGTPAPTRIDVGGSPRDLAVVPQTGHLYVAHRDHAHVTVVSLSSGDVLGRVSLGPACSDGIDNDGDGKTDTDDAGCDDESDRVEGDPEVGANCNDGKDNDGDGDTDAVDLGCSVTVDACRDGVDNDGDGKTDFPDDPGCVGFASTRESWDAPACGDGVDNDGDGKTDTDDSDCSDASGEGERGQLAQGVRSACNDGVDNDSDGKTDTDDSDCPSADSDGELRPPCADGIDNDGDGKTDTDDDACTNRGSPSEVRADNAPLSAIAATFGGDYVVVTHRRKRAAYIIDTATRTLVTPGSDPKRPFRRASALDAADGIDGVALGSPPLALAPATIANHDAMVISTQLNGLFYLAFKATVPVDPPAVGEDGEPVTEVVHRIGLIATDTQAVTEARQPSLVVEGDVIDLGFKAPERHAHFGTLNKETQDDGTLRYYGLTMSTDTAEHRTEVWRIKAAARLPGTLRSTGRMLAPDTLADPTADFCQLGVVPGDRLVIHRGASAADCGGLTGADVSYTVTQVGPETLTLAAGEVDRPVTVANQLSWASVASTPVPLPPAGCLPRQTIRYEVRASGWLVEGVRTGLLSRRGRVGDTCAPWDNQDPTQAARIVQPQLKAGADISALTCPLTRANLDLLEAAPYGGGAAQAVTPFANPVWSGSLLPGCAAADTPDAVPVLVPPVRDTAWTYQVTRGFRPRYTPVGANPVALRSGVGRSHVWVADQGSGTLYSVGLSDGKIDAQLD